MQSTLSYAKTIIIIMKTILSLIRHGHVHNPDNIFYGRLPRFPLSEKGKQQARCAADILTGRRLSAVFSSPLLRARQTAKEIIYHYPHLRLRITELISEISTPFEGRPANEVDARNGDVYTGSAPRYEQPLDVFKRVQKFMIRTRRQFSGEHTVAVTHGDVIAMAVMAVQNQQLNAANKARLRPLGISDGYPALASITSFTFRTNSPDELPEVHYLRPY
jgi:broad specificity phosphatase PhoE